MLRDNRPLPKLELGTIVRRDHRASRTTLAHGLGICHTTHETFSSSARSLQVSTTCCNLTSTILACSTHGFESQRELLHVTRDLNVCDLSDLGLFIQVYVKEQSIVQCPNRTCLGRSVFQLFDHLSKPQQGDINSRRLSVVIYQNVVQRFVNEHPASVSVL